MFSVVGVVAVVLVVLLYQRRHGKSSIHSSGSSSSSSVYEHPATLGAYMDHEVTINSAIRPVMEDFGDDDENHLLL